MNVKSCKISHYVPYKSYKNKEDLYNLKRLREVNIYGNDILNAIIGHIPYMNLDISYKINNNWYKFKFLKTVGKNLVFEQYTMSDPHINNQIQTVRHVYIELI